MTDIQGCDTSVLAVTLMPPDGLCSQSYTESVLKLYGHPATAKALLTGGGPMFIPTTPLRISEMRNGAATFLLDQSEAEWLLFIDSDMGFDPDAVELLLAAADPVNAPVIGALCFGLRKQESDGQGGWRGVPFPTVMDWDGKGFQVRYGYTPNVITRVAATGAAFLLIHRSVLEAMRAEAGDTWFDRARMHTEDAGLMGEDISFCARLGRMGIPIHVHTGVRTSHLKPVWVNEEYFQGQRALAALSAQAADDE